MCAFTTELSVGTWSNDCLVDVTVTFLAVLLSSIVDESLVNPLSIRTLRAHVLLSIVIWSFSISALVIEEGLANIVRSRLVPPQFLPASFHCQI